MFQKLVSVTIIATFLFISPWGPASGQPAISVEGEWNYSVTGTIVESGGYGFYRSTDFAFSGRWVRLLGLAVISASLLVTDSGAQAPQACPSSIPLYELIPYTWPCPIGVPQCHTAYGLCLWPLEVPAPHLGTVNARAPVLPGQPCSCVARNGARVPGVIRVGGGPHQ